MPQSVGEIALDIVVGQNNVGNAVRGAVNDVENTVNGGTGRISGALGKIGGVATKVGAAATAAVGVAAAGIGAIGKQAVEKWTADSIWPSCWCIRNGRDSMWRPCCCCRWKACCPRPGANCCSRHGMPRICGLWLAAILAALALIPGRSQS